MNITNKTSLFISLLVLAICAQVQGQDGSSRGRHRSGLIGQWQGPNGRPYYFNGTGGVEIGNLSNLDLPNGSPWTIEAWINPTSDSSQHVAGKRGVCQSGDGFYQIALDRNPPGTGMSIDPADAPPNTWTHAVIAADGVSGWVVFANGVQVKTVSARGWRIESPGKFIVGGSGSCTPFTGWIAEVFVYNRALTAKEVGENYRSGRKQMISIIGQAGIAPPPGKPSMPVSIVPEQSTPVRVRAVEAEKLLIHREQPLDGTWRTVRMEGTVNLELTVTADGTVRDVKVLTGHPLLNELAVQAVEQYKYKPYLVNGQATAIRTTTEVVFRLLR